MPSCLLEREGQTKTQNMLWPLFFLLISNCFRSYFFQLLTSLLIWYCLLALPTFRVTHGAGFPACHVWLVTLWYLGIRARSDEKGQISYRVVCVCKRKANTKNGLGKRWLSTLHKTSNSTEQPLLTYHKDSVLPWECSRQMNNVGGGETYTCLCTHMQECVNKQKA